MAISLLLRAALNRIQRLVNLLFGVRRYATASILVNDEPLEVADELIDISVGETLQVTYAVV